MGLQERYKQNCTAYIIAYAIVGMVNGLVYDVLITYLMLVSSSISKSIASFMGIATFAAAAIAIMAPKIGYKKIMQFAAAATLVSLLTISNSHNQWVISLGLLSLMTGTALFDVMLPPFIAAYTLADNRTSIFTKASFAGTFGLVLGTFIGGPLVIWLFSGKLNLGYSDAKLLTESLCNLNPAQYAYYIESYRMVIMTFALLSILILIALFYIKELREDLMDTKKTSDTPYSSLVGLVNRYAIIFLVYSIMGRFSSALIVPQVSIYLTKLGLNRAAVSVISTMQYLAILVFMLFSVKIVKKVGQVYAIVALTCSAIPFMIILANGNHYGSSTGLIVGLALFFRTGFCNSTMPAVNSLTMELIPKNSRSLYSSLVFVMQSIAQVFAGLFANFYLFKTDIGYANAYYYAAVLYIISHILLLIFFAKRHGLPKYSEHESIL